MALGRELLNDLTERLENPLANIGLTEEILSLELTTEELYEVSRKFARTLLAIVHEDRVTPTERTKALQARFSSAMTSLKDVETFTAALGAFKRRNQQAKAELSQERNDRAEMSALNNRTQADLGEALLRVRRMENQLGIEKRQLSYIESENLIKSRRLTKKVLEAELQGRIVARQELKVTKKVLMDLRATAKARLDKIELWRKKALTRQSMRRQALDDSFLRRRIIHDKANNKLRVLLHIARSYNKQLQRVNKELRTTNKKAKKPLTPTPEQGA